jgi:hypothetical protein
MNAEQIIKAALDGKFFRLDVVTGAVTVKKVPLDHIPDHRPANMSDIVPDRIAPAHHKPWTPEEDDLIVRLRGEGQRWETIARTVRRALSTIRLRYEAVCRERGIPMAAARAQPAVRLSDHAKAEIIRLRALGMGFPEINEVLGLKGFTARDYHSYYVQKKRAERHAA